MHDGGVLRSGHGNSCRQQDDSVCSRVMTITRVVRHQGDIWHVTRVTMVTRLLVARDDHHQGDQGDIRHVTRVTMVTRLLEARDGGGEGKQRTIVVA